LSQGVGSPEPVNRDLIVVGAPAGGLEAAKRLLGYFPVDLPAAVCVALHVGASSYLAPSLARHFRQRALEYEEDAELVRKLISERDGRTEIDPAGDHAG
jgi:chemotaxis response regulator CheB